jgi:hypothetical protein
MIADSSDATPGLEPRSIAAMPYSDRQFLIVFPDNVAELERKTELGLLHLSQDEWRRSFTGLPPAILDDAYDIYKKAREKHFGVLFVSKTESDQLTFPIGHPRYLVQYVAHPANRATYVPMASFHRFIFEQKVAEAEHLLLSLGATNIEVEHAPGSGDGTEANFGATGTVGAEAGKRKKHVRRVSSKMHLQPDRDPEIPKGLAWFEHEPLWQEVARARLEAGLESFELDIHYTDDFGVNAKLSAEVEGIGIDIGGSFNGNEHEMWRLSGNFRPIRRGLKTADI